METFRRARSEEQRGARRAQILGVAAAMLDEMPVADVSLNELSRRVGLAKSNVLRYFDSREGVLLELLATFLQDWLTEVGQVLDGSVDEHRSAPQQADLLATILARTLAARPVLCDLIGAQGAVLEHNISVEVVVRHKQTSVAQLAAAGDVVRRHLPGVNEGAERLVFHILVMVGALAPYSSPPAGVRAAYELEPALAVLHLDLEDSLQVAIRTLLLGALPRTEP